MNFKNFPMVSKVVYGRGSFNQINEIIEPKRSNERAPFIYLIDDVFKSNTNLISRISLLYDDYIIFITSDEEPKTTQVDTLVEEIILKTKAIPSGIIGIGGGTVMDLAKSVSVMLTNNGSSEEYQGWDLLKYPGVYHVGVPTISGTGAEVSRTAVLSGSKLKLGLNSDFTPFDQVILDPELTSGVEKNQWFYTAMDCFIHCVESLNGNFINSFSKSYGKMAYSLCLDVFLNDDLNLEEKQNKLMMASWHGGMSIAYSQVGVAHALSYGLSYVLGVRHGLGNCLVFNHLEEFYAKDVTLFKQMIDKHQISLPKGICKSISRQQLDKMIDVAMNLNPLWENAIGADWKSVITRSKLEKLYLKM
jgi:3-deoxy-alpha-D-manno-octulosonate 8-oxidase